MKIKDLCASERPRERLMAQGAESLSNSELLAILIKSGTRESSAIEVASALLKNCDHGYSIPLLSTSCPSRE